MRGLRRALVTGGTDGIGLEIVRLLASRDVRVIAVGRRRGPNIEGVSWAIADQSDPEPSAAVIAAACETAGGVDAAILCAGTGTHVADGPEGADVIRRTMRVNLTASILIAHALAPMLLDRRGTLALVGSVARKGAATLPSYAASKAGLHGFARALGEEWRGRATVMVLHPGPTRTNMQAKAGLDVGRAARMFVPAPLAARTILGRIEAAHGSLRPHAARVAHGAAFRRALLERIGLAR